MTVDLDAVATADLAELLAVVERWAGLATTDDETAETFGDPQRRAAPAVPIDPPPTSGRSGVGQIWPDASSSPRHRAEHIPSGPPAAPAPLGDRWHPPRRPVAHTEMNADLSNGVGVDIPEGGPGLVPQPTGDSSEPIHWAGRLPTMRPAPVDGERLRRTRHRAPQPDPPAATRSTPTEDRARPGAATSQKSATGPTDAGLQRAVRSPSGSQPTSVVRAAPGTTRFPIPVLTGHGATARGSVEAAAGRSGNPSNAPVGGAVSTPVPPASSASSSAGIAPIVAELIARDRLGEAIADVIEDALLDAGVDVS